jgi:hypothetical protein
VTIAARTTVALDPIARYGFRVAAALFVLAYAVVLTDKAARPEMLPWFATTILSIGFVLWDERRLPPARRADAFPVSGALHLVAFLQLAVALHFLRTRWKDGWLRALAVAAAGTILVTIPELILAPSEPDETVLDLVLSVVVLALLPLPLLLLWRAFSWLEDAVGLQRWAVGLGVGILGASTLACLAALAFV